MQLDWTTFALEIVNFLVLLWLLKRFLYQPVLASLAARRAGIERSLNEARAAEARAGALKSQFEGRLADWQQEKASARARFEEEMTAARQRQLEALQRELAVERERQAARETHRWETRERELEALSNQQARRFASELLATLAGPELEGRLIDLFIDDLATLPEARLTPLRASPDSAGHVSVASAYPLSIDQRRRISTAVDHRLGTRGAIEFTENEDLLAGIRVSLGAWQLDCSLCGELAVFGEASHFAE